MTAEDTIAEQLRRIVRLLTILVTKELSQKEQIVVLSSAGFQPKEVAELISTTPNTVSVTLSNLRRSGSPRRSQRRQPGQT